MSNDLISLRKSPNSMEGGIYATMHFHILRLGGDFMVEGEKMLTTEIIELR